jgi:hypothetical protein
MGGITGLALLLTLPGMLPQSPAVQSNSYWTLHLAGGRSLLVLGTSDARNNLQLGLDYVKPEKHFRIGKRSGSWFQELYYEHSGSKAGTGYFGAFPSQYDAVGYLFGARYTWGLQRYKLYGDFGLGLSYDTRRTEDLSSRLNSTPFLDFGVVIPNGRNPLSVGLRLLHVSNAGFVAHNAGQNQLFLVVGIRL